MEKPVYPINTFENGLYHFFDSVSDNIVTKKVVAFSPSTENEQIYRLVFGDLLPNGNIDVYGSSQNKDMELILSTVIKAIESFFVYHPEKIISFAGSTPARTRLYRAVINKFIDNLENQPELSYKIYGFTDDNEIEPFQKDKIYIGYLIHKKNENS